MVDIDGIAYLTVEEACGMLGVKPATIYAYVSRGVLRSYKQGIRRQRLYRRDEVEALLLIQPGNTVPTPDNDVVDDGAEVRSESEPTTALPLADGWIGER